MLKEQFLKFILVGITSTVINYSIFYVFYSYFFLNYLFSAFFGYVAGVFVGYSLNVRWTFGVKKDEERSLLKYLLIYLLTLILAVIFLYSLVAALNFKPSIAYIFVVVFATLTNFIGMKYWVFKK
tara:strand:- start:72 stop:446 length:375 start_codon:yes stop_codon:yes gene_type:complete